MRENKALIRQNMNGISNIYRNAKSSRKEKRAKEQKAKGKKQNCRDNKENSKARRKKDNKK